ncbi:thiosulfate/3-mercaptopyruvate sulfurtransferase [Saccharopolyspora phatthalungensis]|uniref:Thiosulfate/3-mercaptopyruvate sulfurtransferase n=1 Tax=Saccharopolyspora phatthalungensis TaxID=664693 RepID=A0A840Q6M8_9PSEU|nr:thiosulfate/3-mercaptopyruvate sulfurtransferase [Saccharopolyspora phatthalungensis]
MISTDDLTSALWEAPPPTLLDVRWSLLGPPGREDFERGHLPGAVYVDLDTDLAAEPGPAGRHPLPDPGDLEAVLRRAGVDGDRPVVVYDADNGSVAARAWWLLRWAGHESVAVLDGGYAAWVAEERTITTDRPNPAEGDFRVRPGSMPVVDADSAARLAREGILLDARAPERYRGDVEPVDPRPGHIPGALNAPFSAHVAASGRWRSPEELAKHFADLGVDAVGQVGAYCGSGVTACSVLLALEHAGVTDRQHPAVLYPGSWSNWSADPARPAATGSEAG